MKQKLSEEQANALRVSVFVSKTTQTITQQQIADGYELGLWTLRRYYEPEYRNLSRITDRRRTHLLRFTALSKPPKTGRCGSCGIILVMAPGHDCMNVRYIPSEYGNSSE